MYLSCNVTSRDHGVMRIYEWKLLAECQHPEKSIGAVMVETKCFQFIK